MGINSDLLATVAAKAMSEARLLHSTAQHPDLVVDFHVNAALVLMAVRALTR